MSVIIPEICGLIMTLVLDNIERLHSRLESFSHMGSKSSYTASVYLVAGMYNR